MIGFLGRLFRLRSGEQNLALTMGFLLLSNALALNMADVVAISGFLDEVGTAQVLLVWTANMLLIALTTGVQSLVVDRFHRIRLMAIMTQLIFLAYLFLRLMFALGAPDWLIYSLLYLLAEQQGLFFPLVFWVLANDIFDVVQARRLIPFISSWAFAGQILGLGFAAAAPFVLPRFGLSSIDLLILNAIIFALAYVFLRRGLRWVRLRRTRHQHESVRETLTEGWGFVREVPSFRYLMLSMLAVYLAVTVLEFHFLAESERAPLLGSAGSFQTFYGLYQLGITLAAVVLQSLLTSRFIEKVNLKNSFVLLPSVLTVSLTAVLAIPGLISTALALAVSYLTKDSVDDAAQKSLQGMVPKERRGRVSLFMDSYLYAAGTILGCALAGGVVFIGLRWQGIAVSQVYLGLALLIGLFALGSVLKMRTVYESSLLNWRLKRRQRRASVLDKLKF